MSNEMMWFLFAIVNFVMIVVSYKLFGRLGLIAWIAMGTVVANIQVVKFVELFGLTATLGNIMFGTLFLATDTLNEKYGVTVAKRSVFIGFFSLIAFLVLTQMMLWFAPLDVAMQEAMQTVFGLLGRVVLGSLTAYLVSQLIDVHLFDRIKRMLAADKWLFVRNLGSTSVSQLIDSLVFVTIAFVGVVSTTMFWEIVLTTYVIKLIVAALDTPFIYAMKRITPLR